MCSFTAGKMAHTTAHKDLLKIQKQAEALI
jgi:hypothetical protein